MVWHSTQNQRIELERTQEVALILKQEYVDYEHALKITGMETLNVIRQKLCLSFEVTEKMFSIKKHIRSTRKQEKYIVPFSKFERFGKSAIPYLARLFNNFYF